MQSALMGVYQVITSTKDTDRALIVGSFSWRYVIIPPQSSNGLALAFPPHDHNCGLSIQQLVDTYRYRPFALIWAASFVSSFYWSARYYLPRFVLRYLLVL